MKTTMLLFLSLLFSLSSFSQDIPVSQVPAAVTKSFTSYFPHTSNSEWEKKGGKFEVSFDIKRSDHKALFENNGKLIVYKKDIPQSQLPAAIKQIIRQQYSTFKVDEVEMIARNGHVYYQVELDGKPQDLKLVFTKDGKLDNSKAY